MASQSTSTELRTTRRRASAATRNAAMDARAALLDLGRAMPDVARTSRGLMTGAMRAIEQGSDDSLSTGASISLGLAIGLLIGGAPRLLVILALAPATAMSLQLVDRQKGRAPRSSAAA